MPDIPDHFYCVHTARGRELGRDQLHWFRNCCRVNIYVQLPRDGQYDPLRDGINETGVHDPSGMKLEYLVVPNGIVKKA